MDFAMTRGEMYIEGWPRKQRGLPPKKQAGNANILQITRKYILPLRFPAYLGIEQKICYISRLQDLLTAQMDFLVE